MFEMVNKVGLLYWSKIIANRMMHPHTTHFVGNIKRSDKNLWDEWCPTTDIEY